MLLTITHTLQDGFPGLRGDDGLPGVEGIKGMTGEPGRRGLQVIPAKRPRRTILLFLLVNKFKSGRKDGATVVQDLHQVSSARQYKAVRDEKAKNYPRAGQVLTSNE